jgi:hypothetical protein
VSRSLSTPAAAAAAAQETPEIYLSLVTIDHALLAAPIRLVNDVQDAVSDGHTFQAFAFDLVLPDETEDQLPEVHLRVDNTDLRIVQAARSIRASTPATVSYQVVLRSSPDTIEAGPFAMRMKPIEYDEKAVDGTLLPPAFLTESFPADIFTPANFPGLFDE